MTNLFLIRHGQSEGNADHTAYEQKGDFVELTRKGAKQAVEAAFELKGCIKRDSYQLYSSPLARARQTAEIISAINKPYINTEEYLLVERRWSKEYREIVKSRKNPDIFSYNYTEDGIESFREVHQRAKKFLKGVVPICQDIVIVGHGEMLRTLLMELRGSLFEDTPHIKNCEVIRVNYDFYKKQTQGRT